MKRGRIMRKRGSKRSSDQASGGVLSNGRLPCPSAPPPYTANLIVRKRFRFYNSNTGATGATVYTLTSPKLCGLIAIGGAANVAYQLFEAVRLRSVSVWSNVLQTSGQFLPQSVGILFSGVSLGVAGADILHSDMSVGATRVARVKARPEPNSQAAQWQAGSTGITSTWFQINCGSGAVIDIDADFAVTSDSRTSANSATLTATTAGVLYYLALDNAFSGAGSVSNNLVPIAELITTA